jgi:HD superfamily phosphohydrolase
MLRPRAPAAAEARKNLPVATPKRFSVLRDPVHGDVYLTHEELALLDTPQMQRLRGVKQLGSANLVYPGAVHTRFEHSIGAVHLAQKMIDAINLSFEQSPRECLGVGEPEARVIRVAALLHDVTHIPFGHNVEDQAGLMHRHDTPYRFERMLGPQTALGRTLRELGLAKDVLNVLLSESGAATEKVPPYWHQIESDTICCDILDYLARDAYFTGLKLAVDPRLYSYFRVDRASGNLCIDLAKHNLLREDILSEMVRLLESRYFFSERVYYHHAKVAAGALVARAVELALAHGLLKEEDFYDQTDASVLDLLERSAAEGEAARRCDKRTSAQIRSAVERFRQRKLPKRAAVFPRLENEAVQEDLVARYFAREGRAARAQAEDRIADLVRFATGRDVEILITCPARRMQLKEAQTHVRWPGAAGVRPCRSIPSACRVWPTSSAPTRALEVLRVRGHRRQEAARAHRRDRRRGVPRRPEFVSSRLNRADAHPGSRIGSAPADSRARWGGKGDFCCWRGCSSPWAFRRSRPVTRSAPASPRRSIRAIRRWRARGPISRPTGAGWRSSAGSPTDARRACSWSRSSARRCASSRGATARSRPWPGATTGSYACASSAAEPAPTCAGSSRAAPRPSRRRPTATGSSRDSPSPPATAGRARRSCARPTAAP